MGDATGKNRPVDSGIDWETQADLDEQPNIAPPDHDWLAHEAGYPDDEIDDIEAWLLADDGTDANGRSTSDG